MLAHGGTLCPLELIALPALVVYAFQVAVILLSAEGRRGR